jgi:hypothetical protein
VLFLFSLSLQYSTIDAEWDSYMMGMIVVESISAGNYIPRWEVDPHGLRVSDDFVSASQ